MIAALKRLSLNQGQYALPKQVAPFGISVAMGHGLRRLLLSHPPLEERIRALEAGRFDGQAALQQGLLA